MVLERLVCYTQILLESVFETKRKFCMTKTMGAICVLASLILSLFGCSTAPPCVSVSAATKYEKKLIRRPGSSPEDGKVYVVRDGRKSWVLSGDWMKKNGYKWPDDVMEIPASDLDSIPLGEPIQ
jgi:hypothetical protein